MHIRLLVLKCTKQEIIQSKIGAICAHMWEGSLI